MEDIKNKINIYEKEFSTFKSLLLEYNEKFNLTAITDEDEIKTKHFEDSLYAAEYLGKSILDVGSGAGFPGIPLAIANPDKTFTLIDSIGKRVEFLNKVINECGLKNAATFHKRIEDLDRSKKYDSVTARAVAPLNILCEYCLPFVEVGGNMIAFKGNNVDEEIKNAEKALEILGGAIEKKIEYKLEIKDEVLKRSLVIIRKERECDKKYPRGGNKPRIKPL